MQINAQLSLVQAVLLFNRGHAFALYISQQWQMIGGQRTNRFQIQMMNNCNDMDGLRVFTIPLEIRQQNETKLLAWVLEYYPLHFLFMVENIVHPLQSKQM